jgi:diguanylate cyclase (GGDEF)-like protein/PAS domain S-box-containing protein
MLYFCGTATVSFSLIPTLVGLIIGLLLGHSSLLSQRLAGKTLQFRAVADLAHELTCFRRLDGSFEYVSPSSRRITGHDPEDFYQDPGLMDRLIHHEDRERWERYRTECDQQAREDGLDIRLLTKEGRVAWVNHRSGPVFDEHNRLLGTRSTSMDITERKRAAERIEHPAYHDQLTGLPNRLEIVRRLHQQIQRRAVAAGSPGFALLGFDLRRSKNINDSFGHAFGDRVIPRVAARLRAAQPDGSVLGRIDDDKFALMATDIDTAAAAERLAARMLTTIEQPLRIEGSEVYLSCSVGYVLCPADGDTAEFLPVAEATGQISQLGEYLFERIVDDLRGWENAGLRLPVAVNLSIHEFADPGLCKRLLDRLAGAGCSVGLEGPADRQPENRPRLRRRPGDPDPQPGHPPRHLRCL